jgi:hypothetical protein
MCGILGSPNLTPSVRRMLPFLGVAMESRGRDSWGCASSEGEIYKFSGIFTDNWAQVRERVEEWTGGIFHTRGASPSLNDKIAAANAHPFSYPRADGSMVVGIHNGMISNHKELDTKYERSFPVDSQHLWAHRAAGLPWEDVVGWGNLAWWEVPTEEHQPHHPVLNLCRFNTNALEVAILEQGEYVFCSTQEPLRMAARLFGNPVKGWMKLEEYYHYWFAPGPQGEECTLWKSAKPLIFGKAASTTYTPPYQEGGGYGYTNPPQGSRAPTNPANHSSHSGRNGSGRGSGGGTGRGGTSGMGIELCLRCNKSRVQGMAMLCQVCLRFLVQQYRPLMDQVEDGEEKPLTLTTTPGGVQ